MLTLEDKEIEVIEVVDDLALVNVYKSTSHSDKDLFKTYVPSDDLLGANVVNYTNGISEVSHLEYGRPSTIADFTHVDGLKMLESGSYLVEHGWVKDEGEDFEKRGKETLLASQRIIRQQAEIIDTPNYLERPIVYSLRMGSKGYMRIFKAFYNTNGHFWVNIAANTLSNNYMVELLESNGFTYGQDKDIINQLNEANKIITLV